MEPYIKPEEDDDVMIVPPESATPSLGYTDYILRSTAPSSTTGWRYNIMKFNAMADKQIDPTTFTTPVRLNRKDPRTVRRLNDEEIERINRGGAAKEEEIEEVKEVKKEKEEIDLNLVGTGANGLAPALRTKSNMFKKKTKRVFVSSEEARRLKREEWMPWVLEDSTATERWVGRLEGGTAESGSNPNLTSAAARSAKAANEKGTGMSGWRPPPLAGDVGSGGSSYVAFVSDGNEFNVVPANRWYKFTRGPKYVTLGMDEAEEQYTKQQKNPDAERWVMHKRQLASKNAVASGSGSTPNVKKESTPGPSIRSRILDNSIKSAVKVEESNRSFKTVVSGNNNNVYGKRRKSGAAGEQDDDEFDFEVDFQDDEEGIAKIDDMADEDDIKELDNRIKKEMRGANRPNDPVDEDSDEFEEVLLNSDGKGTKKLVKKIEKKGAYESEGEDEDENPYASQDEYESEQEETPETIKKEATAPKLSKSTSSSSHRRPSSHSSRPGSSTNSRPGSRSGSPAPTSAMVAKRATSPNGKRSNSISRGNSPSNSRGTSPVPSSKRKLESGEVENGKKRRAEGELEPLITEGEVVEYLKNRTKVSTKDILTHFRKSLKGNELNRNLIGGLLQRVSNLVEGYLVLKDGY